MGDFGGWVALGRLAGCRVGLARAAGAGGPRGSDYGAFDGVGAG